jgi:hypothetical protein
MNTWYKKFKIEKEDIFFNEILYLMLASHFIPLREYAFDFLPEKEAKLVTLKTHNNEEITTNLDDLPNPKDIHFNQLTACSVLNSAYEKIVVNNLKDNSPILEFLRHLRNASSHGRNFSFRGNEPTKEAYWKKLVISNELQGTNMFEFIGIADVVLLLKDIQSHLR